MEKSQGSRSHPSRWTPPISSTTRSLPGSKYHPLQKGLYLSVAENAMKSTVHCVRGVNRKKYVRIPTPLPPPKSLFRDTVFLIYFL